jgi:hypothetical protein
MTPPRIKSWFLHISGDCTRSDIRGFLIPVSRKSFRRTDGEHEEIRGNKAKNTNILRKTTCFITTFFINDSLSRSDITINDFLHNRPRR